MNKLLFSLLLSAVTCMTIIAAPPRVNADNVKVGNGRPGAAMLSKDNTLSKQLIAPAMRQAQASSNDAMTPQRFFAERGITPNANRLTRTAPRRLNSDDILLNDKLAFMIAYEYDAENDYVARSKNYMQGGWVVQMEQMAENQFNAYLFFNEIPFTIDVDYEAGTAEMVMETLGGWQWIDTIRQGSITIYNDTTEYIALWDEAFMLNGDSDAEPTNIVGTIYDDGSIYFPDGWTLYDVMYVKMTTIRNGVTRVTYDTIAGLLCDFMHNTYLLTANATHDYDYQGDGTIAHHYQNLAYMFQYDKDSVMVWNLWGLGGQGSEFLIHEDGSMVFPCMQVVGTGEVDDLEETHPDYDWQTYGYNYYNVDGDWNAADQYGIVTPKTLEWDATAWGRLCVDPSTGGGEALMSVNPQTADGLSGTSTEANEAIYMACYYPMLNNVLTFTNYDFFKLGVTAAPEITSFVDEENVVVTACPADDLETELLLCIFDDDYENFTIADNPCTIKRTDEDQTIIFGAIAQAYGKEVSEWTFVEVTIPAKEPKPLLDKYYNRFFLTGLVEGWCDETLVIPVGLDNEADITAFQTDLYLPEGFELVDVELSERAAADHVCETNTMPDGAIRILCYSNSLATFEDKWGDLFYLTVRTPDEETIDYSIYYELLLKNTLLTAVWGEDLQCEEIHTYDEDLVLDIIIKGDANLSGKVTVTDVVVTAQYILGKNPRPFIFDAANMNDDENITVTDAVLIARKVLYPDLRHLLRAPAMSRNDDTMSGEGINIRAGETRTVTISLDNEAQYTAFQLDLQLPDGLTASNFALTDRAGSHAVEANVLADGKQRVMCYSPQLETIGGDNGALLTFEVTATHDVSGDIMVDGIEMVTAACQTAYLDGFAIQVNSENTTALNELGDGLRITAEGHDIIIDSPVAQRAIISDIAGRARSVDLSAGRNVITEAANGVFIVRVGQNSAKLMIR